MLVIRASLKVPGARRLVTELCQSARASSTGKATLWISRDAPPRPHQHLFDFNLYRKLRRSCGDGCLDNRKSEAIRVRSNEPVAQDDGQEDHTTRALTRRRPKPNRVIPRAQRHGYSV